jgi:prepilin-type N-terminal cleavage/methylation domain-containing protein
MRAGFTLVELIIIVIIIGILATFATPQYIKTQERGLDNEAKANLVMLQSAENIYKSESSSFYASAVHADLNTNLEITLPTAGGKWNYSTKIIPAVGVTPIRLCAQAKRNGSDNRSWYMMDIDNTPSVGTCP